MCSIIIKLYDYKKKTKLKELNIIKIIESEYRNKYNEILKMTKKDILAIEKLLNN